MPRKSWSGAKLYHDLVMPRNRMSHAPFASDGLERVRITHNYRSIPYGLILGVYVLRGT
jgi:hypothetical protein